MKVSTERLPESQVMLSVEVEPELVEQYIQKAYLRLVQRTNVPGFRRGKAPRAMLERYLGRSALLEEALDRLLPDLYQKAVEEEKIEAIAQPRLEVTQLDPVIFKATVPVRPTVELGDYHKIELDPEPVEVAEEAPQAALEALRSQQAPWEPVDRPVQFGDRLTIDVEGSLGGKPILEEKGMQFPVLQGLSVPVPGFAEELVGMERDQEREFRITFPSDHPRTDLAGQEASFRVRVTEIKEKRLPELDDEFAKGVGEGFQSLEQLRQRIAENLMQEEERKAQQRLEEKALKALVEGARIELPSLMIEERVEDMLQQRREALRRERIALEDYLEAIKKTEAELREELRPLALEQVQGRLALDKLAELEGLQVTPQEVEAEVEKTASASGEQGGEVRRLFALGPNRQALERDLLRQKALSHLVAIATQSQPQQDTPDSEVKGERTEMQNEA